MQAYLESFRTPKSNLGPFNIPEEIKKHLEKINYNSNDNQKIVMASPFLNEMILKAQKNPHFKTACKVALLSMCYFVWSNLNVIDTLTVFIPMTLAGVFHKEIVVQRAQSIWNKLEKSEKSFVALSAAPIAASLVIQLPTLLFLSIICYMIGRLGRSYTHY